MIMSYKDNLQVGFARAWMAACLMVLALAGCGGGGGDSGGAFQPPDPIRVTISAATSTTVPANPLELAPDTDNPFTVQLNVRVVTNTGTPVPDGTTVNLTINNLTVGALSTLDDPATDDINEFTTLFGQINTTTAGGNATFFFTSGTLTGSAVITASAADINSTFTATGSITMTVVPSPTDNRITLEATRVSLPANVNNVPPFIGSPFMSEVTLRFRGVDGDFTSPQGGNFGAAISPVTVAAFSTLDDPATTDINEFFVLLGNGPVNSAAGQGTIFIHSGATPGIATITVTGADPLTGEEFDAQLQVEIVDEAATGLPTQATISQNADPVFIQGSGGPSSKVLDIQVLDGGDEPIDDPVAGTNRFNNVLVRLTPPENNGSRLSGADAAGTNVAGQEISVATTNGIVQVAFNSGTRPGIHRIDAIVDRADNNVDNGLQDPLTTQEDISVGDGILFSLEIDSPLVNAIQINSVSDVVDPENPPLPDPDTGLIIPPDPDATYRLTLSVTANDVIGNPVISGTNLQIGKVDSPLDPVNGSLFNFSGVDGNPVEGGNLFTVVATADGFLDNAGVDEAVEIGDTLLTFGDLLPGNREMEAARFVNSVSTDTILRVNTLFNNNDGSGVIVDDGSVIPYIIGRSTVGNVPGAGQTEDDGVSEFSLTYPTSAVGRPVALWVQGNRTDNGELQTVADVVVMSFPGIAPATLAVFPNTIRGNTTVPITICVADALSVPIQNILISFSTSGVGNFSVSDDPLITGPDGCVDTLATSDGLTVGQENLVVNFFGAGATAQLAVVPPTTAFISASPSLLVLTATAGRAVTVTVIDEDDNPVPNVQISATCDAPVTVVPGQSSTDADGEAIFTLTTTDMPMETVSGTCTFTATLGSTQISTSIVYSIPAVPPSP